jgi:2'-5' RNA ligase
MLRTFIALTLDDVFIAAAASLIESLRSEPELARGRWVASSALHITLRFLGDTDESLVPALASLVAELGEAAHEPIDVWTRSLLAFPSERRAHVLGLRFEPNTVMLDLAERAERAAVALGFAPEAREFRPHLTLARIRKAPADLRRLVADRPLAIAGRVTSITLYKSELGSTGPTYAPLAQAVLREPA